MSRYLKQVIVVRKDLCMPTGKFGAMVAHAAMSFITSRIAKAKPGETMTSPGAILFDVTAEQAQWLTELDPGLEDHGQVSFAKIVCQVADESELLTVETRARAAGLECHRVIDSGHSHNELGDFVCIAIGPDWPERLDPVTGGLKVYR